jgi:hypothetical protein
MEAARCMRPCAASSDLGRALRDPKAGPRVDPCRGPLVRAQKLEGAVPNMPKITAGALIACETGRAAVTNAVDALV